MTAIASWYNQTIPQVYGRIRATVRKASTSVQVIGLADLLIVGGMVSAVIGTVELFGWPVALLAFGLGAMLAGIALVMFEARR